MAGAGGDIGRRDFLAPSKKTPRPDRCSFHGPAGRQGKFPVPRIRRGAGRNQAMESPARPVPWSTEKPYMNVIAAPLPSLKRHKPFALFWVMRVTTTGAYFMQSVAIGWQIYDMTGNPLDLGLVGLVQFFPLVLLAVVVGQIIDRYDRRAIARTCQIVKAVCALVLALGSARRLARPRRHLPHPAGGRHGARVRDADLARAGAEPGAAAAAAARDRRIGDREPDRDHLRARARRADLCVRPDHGLCDLRLRLHRRPACW